MLERGTGGNNCAVGLHSCRMRSERKGAAISAIRRGTRKFLRLGVRIFVSVQREVPPNVARLRKTYVPSLFLQCNCYAQCSRLRIVASTPAPSSTVPPDRPCDGRRNRHKLLRNCGLLTIARSGTWPGEAVSWPARCPPGTSKRRNMSTENELQACKVAGRIVSFSDSNHRSRTRLKFVAQTTAADTCAKSLPAKDLHSHF
jgi:hypothetical protein